MIIFITSTMVQANGTTQEAQKMNNKQHYSLVFLYTTFSIGLQRGRKSRKHNDSKIHKIRYLQNSGSQG